MADFVKLNGYWVKDKKINDMVDNEDLIINNHTRIHIENPTFLRELSFIPDGRVANGFALDNVNYYIAHITRGGGTDVQISVINRETLQDNIYTGFEGHGNTLYRKDDYLYMCDSNTGRVDIINIATMEIVKTFTLDPKINGFAIREINGDTYTVSTNFGNTQIALGWLYNNMYQELGFLGLENENSWIQGLYISDNNIYVSRSYGVDITRKFYNYPTIQAIGYDGNVLNNVYINLSKETKNNTELEDIYKDGDSMYFVTGGGKVGYINMSGFTTPQTDHKFSPRQLRKNEILNMVKATNDNPTITYKENCLLADEIKINPNVTRHQGQYIGIGLIAGVNAMFFNRAGKITGTMVNVDINGANLFATVEYSITSGKLKYVRGVVTLMQNGSVIKRDLAEWSLENPNIRTVINTLVHTPYDTPYDTLQDIEII